VSEAYSFELLNILLGNRIDLDKTETEIKYDDEQSKITDYSLQTLAGDRFGVSVTRACGNDFRYVIFMKFFKPGNCIKICYSLFFKCKKKKKEEKEIYL
jgi:hypothetical protein